MLQVLAHADLLHELVLVAVHAGELAHVREYVLDAVGKLKGVHISQSVLDMGVDDQLDIFFKSFLECLFIFLFFYDFFTTFFSDFFGRLFMTYFDFKYFFIINFFLNLKSKLKF